MAAQTTYMLNVENLVSTGRSSASPNNTTSIDHNLYIRATATSTSPTTRPACASSPSARCRPATSQEVAWFDVYPENDNASFEGGTWSNYGQYRGGKIAVSSIDRGLFVLEFGG